MQYTIWTDDLNTGIAVIDGQHRQIADFLNHLVEAHATRDREALHEVVRELTEYTMSHFSFEEALMDEVGYEFALPHKRIHEVLKVRVREYGDRLNAGEDITFELHGLLRRWLIGHIKQDDAAYVKAVTQHIQNNGTDKHGSWLGRTLGHIFGRPH